MDCVIVSHTHWDREWYRTSQAFRARLVDTVNAVLDLLDEDPLPPGVSLFAPEGPNLVLTALKPREHGTGIVARVLNPTDAPAQAALRWNIPKGGAVSVRLDEEPTEVDQSCGGSQDPATRPALGASRPR